MRSRGEPSREVYRAPDAPLVEPQRPAQPRVVRRRRAATAWLGLVGVWGILRPLTAYRTLSRFGAGDEIFNPVILAMVLVDCAVGVCLTTAAVWVARAQRRGVVLGTVAVAASAIFDFVFADGMVSVTWYPLTLAALGLALSSARARGSTG